VPHGALTHAVAAASKRVPVIKRLPVLKLLALAEIVVLVRRGRGRPSNLSRRDRDELSDLLAKVEPREFVAGAADRLSPVPLPKRLTHGPNR